MEQLTKFLALLVNQSYILPRLFLMPRVHYGRGETNDPADWSSCSTAETPVDASEPEEEILNIRHEYALILIGVFEKIDSRMWTCRDARKTWIAFAIFGWLATLSRPNAH